MKTAIGLILCIIVVCPPPRALASGDGAAVDTSQKWQILLHTVQEILSGSAPGEYSAKIGPGAQLVIGERQFDLGEVVASRDSTLLREDPIRGPVSLRLKMNDQENAAFLLLRTVPDSTTRYHTVVFMKDSTGTWMIESWHASRKEHRLTRH